MAAQATARASPELREAPLSPRYSRNYTTSRGTTLFQQRLARQEQGTVAYFWAWQNLIALHHRQKKMEQVLAECQAVLLELAGRGDAYAEAEASIERSLFFAARKLRKKTIAAQAIQRSYIALRRVKSANDPAVLKARKWIDVTKLDPDTFPYADELGAGGAQRKLTLSPDGTEVLAGFMDGHYIRIGRQLNRLVRDDRADAALVQLNLGLYHALLGEVDPAVEALDAARAAASQSGGASAVTLNSPWFDIYLAMTHSWAREWQTWRAIDPLDRLARRSDLDTAQQRTVDILRVAVLRGLERENDARVAYRATGLDTYDPRGDLSPWGVLHALTALDGIQEFSPDKAREYGDALRETLNAAGSPALAETLMEVFQFNSLASALASERRFQAMAFHIRALSAMLPDEHQWQAVARSSYAFALIERGQMETAVKMLKQATAQYRASPWARKDVIGFLNLQQAVTMERAGDSARAFALIRQSYEEMDIDTYRADTWREILSTYALRLAWAERTDEALAIIEPVATDTQRTGRLAPSDHMQFLAVYAYILDAAGQDAEARAWIARARETLPSPLYREGGPMQYVLNEEAVMLFGHERYGPAYAAMRDSNLLFFGSVEQFSAHADGETHRNKQFERVRIVNEASMAWHYAQSLKSAEAPPPVPAEVVK